MATKRQMDNDVWQALLDQPTMTLDQLRELPTPYLARLLQDSFLAQGYDKHSKGQLRLVTEALNERPYARRQVIHRAFMRRVERLKAEYRYEEIRPNMALTEYAHAFLLG